MNNMLKVNTTHLNSWIQETKIKNRQSFKSLKYLLNNSDKHSMFTIFVQEFIKNNKLKNKIQIAKLITVIKLISILSINPCHDTKLSKAIYTSKFLINHHIQDLLKDIDPELLLKYIEYEKEILKNDELVKLNEIDNKLIKQNDYFFLRQHYHSALKIYFILDYLFKLKDENFKKLLTRIAKYQFLFYWQLNYKEIIEKDPSYKYISYNLISKNSNFYFIKIQESLTKFKYVLKDQYLSHISETYEKVRLSDLPPLNFKTSIMLLINYAILAFWAFIILTPIIQIILLSFESTKIEYLNEKYNPDRKDLPFYQHYKILFKETAFLDWLKNSLGVAIFTTIIVISITTILAYSFSRFRFRGRKTSIMIIMLLQMIPTVTALTSFFVIYNIFTDVFKTSMNIFLVIIYAGGGITGNTFILRGYFNSISQDIDQAAKVDGASNIKTFFTILIPIAKPMIALVALWSFIGPFGDVVLPALLFDGRRESVKHLTMAAGLNTLAGNHQFAYLAGAIITSIPITIGFIIGQSFLVSGLTSGAVK